ncbi:hypothetical protein [Microbulbifer discodermiae]|uniref:hypothetical protein n=1 Tax=Microbulbifer sp. 2201CG32-9 TaxID=3232309 RepID=UPI00345B7B6A
MEKLDIQIITKGSLSQDTEHDIPREYKPEFDNVTSIIEDICEVFSVNENIIFHVSGFGQENWPLDTRTDLLCGIEEINEILNKISLYDFNFEWDLYEQGVERTVGFKTEGAIIIATCTSHTDWQPNPKSIESEREQVKEMFHKFKFDFCNIASIVCPNIASHEWFIQWAGIKE